MARGMGFSSVVLFLLVFAVALGAFVVIRHGVSARDQPTQPEIFVARRLRHLAIPLAARQMSSPEPSTPVTIQAGLEHFADHCAICHANDGSGDTEIGRNLYPKAPDMRREETQSLSDGELFYIIENGIRFTGMPGWGTGKPEPAGNATGTASGSASSGGAAASASSASGTGASGGSGASSAAGHEAASAADHDHDHEGAGHDSWALVHFIRHLPKLTDDEQQKMQALNPRGPEEWEQQQQMQDFLKGGGTGGKGDTKAPPPVESSGHEHHHN
jgi:mono/diheme cytochrome c family protein